MEAVFGNLDLLKLSTGVKEFSYESEEELEKILNLCGIIRSR